MTDINRDEFLFSEEQQDTHFLTYKRNKEILEEVEVKPADEKLKKCK